VAFEVVLPVRYIPNWPVIGSGGISFQLLGVDQIPGEDQGACMSKNSTTGGDPVGCETPEPRPLTLEERQVFALERMSASFEIATNELKRLSASSQKNTEILARVAREMFGGLTREQVDQLKIDVENSRQVLRASRRSLSAAIRPHRAPVAETEKKS
jgi:hypothetical protein